MTQAPIPADAAGAATAETLGAPSAGPSLRFDAPMSAARLASLVRTTILPRVQLNGEIPELVRVDATRYERVRELGSGGVGEVALVRDNDIQRLAARKQLKAEHSSPAAIMRFVGEIRTVGHLEHPGIVPIHDVGVDEQGHYFFVMKYVEGETLEQVIEKLAAGDADAHRRYPLVRRRQIFLQVLRSVQFAHAQGIVHRDIKPANVMVGRFGEVMLMDWGLAKRVRGGPSAQGEDLAFAATLDPATEPTDAGPERMFRTRHGSLLGTPAYMSPEQARGRNDEIDERSDIYSLSALFWELLFLEHYLGPRESMAELLHAVIHEMPRKTGAMKNRHQRETPAELVHYCLRGLAKAPKDRFDSVDEMIARLDSTDGGRCQVECAFTAMKRVGGEWNGFVDRHPFLALGSFAAATATFVYGAFELVRHALGAG